MHVITKVLIFHHSPLQFSHSVECPIMAMATPRTSLLLLNEEGSYLVCLLSVAQPTEERAVSSGGGLCWRQY